MQKIILASQSPRRKQLLKQANISFDVVVKPTDETYPTHLAIENIPIHIAQQKANAISTEYPNHTILAADTIVAIHNSILGKPTDKSDAIRMLQLLSNKTHMVITGIYIQQNNKKINFSDITYVHFNKLTNAAIEYYIDHYKPYDKAGAYGIQEWIGLIGIQYIKGDYYNVMGLPINRVVKALEAF